MMFSARQSTFLAIALLLILLFVIFDVQQYLTLASIKEQREYLQSYVDMAPIVSAFAFLFLYAFLLALCLPVGPAVAVLGGFLFGQTLGFVIAIVAATAGATSLFIIVRHIFRAPFESWMGEKSKALSVEIEETGFVPLMLMRMLPFIPFTFLNIASALSRIKPRDFVLGTFLGIIPELLIYTNAGTRLGEINSFRDIMSLQTLLILCGLVLLVALPLFIKMWRETKERVEHSEG